MLLAQDDLAAWGAAGKTLASTRGIWHAAFVAYASDDALLRNAARHLALHYGASSEALPLLFRIVEDPAPDPLRQANTRAAVRRIGEIGGAGAVGFLATIVERVAADTKVAEGGVVSGDAPMVLESLAAIGGDEASLALVDALEMPALSAIRQHTLALLGRSGSGGTTAARLLRWMQVAGSLGDPVESRTRHRDDVLGVVAGLGGNDVDPVLSDYLQSDAPVDAKIHLLGCVAGRGGDRAVRMALQVVESNSKQLREQARFMLARAGHEPTLGGLVATIGSSAPAAECELAAGLLGVTEAMPIEIRRQMEAIYVRGSFNQTTRAALAVAVARQLSADTPEVVRSQLRVDANDIVDGRLGTGTASAMLGGMAMLATLWGSVATSELERDLVAGWDRMPHTPGLDAQIVRAVGGAARASGVRERVLAALDRLRHDPAKLRSVLSGISESCLPVFKAELLSRLEATAGTVADEPYAEAILRLGVDRDDPRIRPLIPRLSDGARGVLVPPDEDD